MRKLKDKSLEPIENREAWDKLISETKLIVNKQDKSTWDLILLAATVEKSYGDNMIKRWADESGLSQSLARQYKWLANRGVDKAFIAKWARTDRKPKLLTYTVIREICSFCGGVDTPVALEYLQWAVDHSATAIATRGYMYESIAPQGEREQMQADFRLAMQDKQQAEGFSDFVLEGLVRLVEEHPEARETALKTAVVSVDDLEDLKVRAGVVTPSEEDAVEVAKRLVGKMTRFKRFLRDNRVELTQAIEFDHELSDQVKMLIDSVADIAFEVGTHRAPEFAPPPESVVEIEL